MQSTDGEIYTVGDTQGALSGAEIVRAKAIFPFVNMYRVTDDDWDKCVL